MLALVALVCALLAPVGHPVAAGAAGNIDQVSAVYRAHATDGSTVTSETLSQTADTIRRRLVLFGIGDASVQTQDPDQIIVAIPGDPDAATIFTQIGMVGLCEFVGSDFPFANGSLIATTLGGPESVGIFPDAATIAALAVAPIYQTIIQSADVSSAGTQTDFRGMTALQFTLNDAAVPAFRDYTEAHLGHFLNTVLDKHVVISAAIVSSIGKTVALQGPDLDTLRLLKIILQSGPLPVPLEYIATRVP